MVGSVSERKLTSWGDAVSVRKNTSLGGAVSVRNTLHLVMLCL